MNSPERIAVNRTIFRRTGAAWLSLLTLLVAGSGCSNLTPPERKIHYYTLEYPSPKVENPRKIDAVLRIDRFSVAPLYDTMRIVYREDAFRLDNYEYHRWRIHPGELISSLLVRDFRQADIFKAVLAKESRLEAAYRLEGSVEELYEVDRSSGWQAVLDVEIILTDEQPSAQTDRILLQKQYRVVEPCQKNTPQGVVAALSRAMSEISHDVITGVQAAIASAQQ